MSYVPRFPSAVEGQPPSIRTVLAHVPAVQKAYNDVYGTLWSHGAVDGPTKEAARIRNARVTDCGH